jgi:precorrin-6B methylase 2
MTTLPMQANTHSTNTMTWAWYRIATSVKFHGIPFTLLWALMCILRQSPSKWFIAYQKKHFDRRYGIKTDQVILPGELGLTKSQTEGCTAYEPTSPDMLTSVLSKLSIHFGDYTFLDLGSGMGLSVLVASMHPFKRIIGVEWSARLAKIARSNLRKFKHPEQKCHDIEVVESDATTYALPEEPLVLYMFNPFTERLVRQLLNNIAASIKKCPRHVVLVYCRPICKHDVEKSGFLRHRCTFPRYDVEVYETEVPTR